MAPLEPSPSPAREKLLADPLLEQEAVADFRRQCVRIAARHGGWRRNFPAFSGLLDTEVERAHALAGNYATEGRETVGAWLSMQAGQGDDWVCRRSAAALCRWASEYLAVWRDEVLAIPDVAARPEAVRERFVLILDDLLERARQEAETYIEEAAAAPPSPGPIRKVGRRVAVAGRVIWRFFEPR